MLGNLDEFRKNKVITCRNVNHRGSPFLYSKMGYVMFYPKVSSSTVLCFHVENTFAFFSLSANFLLVLFLNVTCLPGMYFNYFCIV